MNESVKLIDYKSKIFFAWRVSNAFPTSYSSEEYTHFVCFVDSNCECVIIVILP